MPDLSAATRTWLIDSHGQHEYVAAQLFHGYKNKSDMAHVSIQSALFYPDSMQVEQFCQLGVYEVT